jgi:hypothetical protein
MLCLLDYEYVQTSFWKLQSVAEQILQSPEIYTGAGTSACPKSLT